LNFLLTERLTGAGRRKRILRLFFSVIDEKPGFQFFPALIFLKFFFPFAEKQHFVINFMTNFKYSMIRLAEDIFIKNTGSCYMAANSNC
jgi:hypothetical protein